MQSVNLVLQTRSLSRALVLVAAGVLLLASACGPDVTEYEITEGQSCIGATEAYQPKAIASGTETTATWTYTYCPSCIGSSKILSEECTVTLKDGRISVDGLVVVRQTQPRRGPIAQCEPCSPASDNRTVTCLVPALAEGDYIVDAGTEHERQLTVAGTDTCPDPSINPAQ